MISKERRHIVAFMIHPQFRVAAARNHDDRGAASARGAGT